nr:glycerate kinase [Raoultella sp. NCTC 9187]
MVQALGGKLLTEDNRQLAAGGAALEALAKIDLSELDQRLTDCRIEVACDVTNRSPARKVRRRYLARRKGRRRR